MAFFADRLVFLAGGSEGIGRATAVALARQGARVVVAARRQGPLDDTLAAMEQAAPGGRFGTLSLDVTDRTAVKEAVATVTELLGGHPDVVITNVGVARPGYVHELEDDAFDQMIDVNYLGHANVVRAFLPGMMAQKRGDICMVSSALGFMSMPGYTAYSASKYAVAGFAEALRMEVAHLGIRVTLFYPGTTDTPGLKSENANKPKAVWTMESDSSFSVTHQPEAVAASVIRAIERGRFENFPGIDIWFVWWMYSRFPKFSRWMADMEWTKARKKAAGGAPVSESAAGT